MKLTGLTWENVFLKAAITSSREKASFYLTKNLQPAGAEERPADSVLVQPDAWEDGVFRFKLNICQMDGRAFLENGGWHLIAETDEGCFPVEADPELAMEFDSLARVFPYAEGKAYTVWFSAEEGPDEKILPVLHSSFVARDDAWKKSSPAKMMIQVLKMRITFTTLFSFVVLSFLSIPSPTGSRRSSRVITTK